MYLTQLLHRHRQGRPDKVALVDGVQRRTYAELHQRVARLAGALRAQGILRGDRIAMLCHNSIELIESLFAAWWVGAIACPINTRWSPPEIAASFRDCTPTLLLVDAANASVATDLLDRFRNDGGVPPALWRFGDCRVPPSDALTCEHEAIADDRFGGELLALLLYTGGTTGRSKGVMLTHANISSAAACRMADTGPLRDSVGLLSTPLFHVAAIARLLSHMTAGGTVVLVPQFKADLALDLIEREGVTDVPLVPSMLQMLIEHPAFQPERLRSLRRIGYGAAPSTRTLLERTQSLLPWVELYQSYGMTESSGVGTLSLGEDHDAEGWASGRASSAGRACTAVEVRVIDPMGRDLLPGEVGEILLRGPTVMAGYWNRPEETAQALRAGWLHTGDAGRLDAFGYLHVVDRIKDMIVTGGENVYSAEVETVLAQHPAVSQCAVIGVADPLWGEAVHAVVVLRHGATADAEALQRHCRAQLANYKCPKAISFLAGLPMTAAGKVAKNVLRQMV